MTSTLLVVQLILGIIITITILLQKSSSIGLGAYSGSNDSVFGAKGPTNFLAKATMGLGLIFVINTLTLGYMYNQERNESAIDNVKTETLVPQIPITQESTTPTAPGSAPVVPNVPSK
jgi:preprotein translocase subunit SecG